MKTFQIFWCSLMLLISLSAHGQYRRSYLQLGQRELWKENYVEAINYFSYYIKDHPNLHKAYFLRGLSKYNLDDLIGAEADLNKAIICLPEFPRLYLIRGVIRAENYKQKEALADFNKAILLDSVFTDAYFYRSLAFLNQRDYESSLNDANRIISLADEYPNVYILRGVIQAQLQDFEKAIDDFTVSIERNPKNGRAYVERGTAYSQLKQNFFAMADFDTALVIDSLDAYAFFQRGQVKMTMLDYEGALKDFNRVVEISPENELAYFNRALIKSNSRAEGEAIEDFIHILNENPDNMLVFFNLGLSFSGIGQYEAALQSFDQAIELYPDYADAWYQRSLVKREMGMMESSIADMDIYENILAKNQEKDDSTKYEEGQQILRLSHLSNEFIKEEERKSKLQYNKTETKLQPIYQVVIDSTFILRQFDFYQKNSMDYQLKSIPFYAEQKAFDSLFIQTRIDTLGIQIASDEFNMNLYLKRGLLLASLNRLKPALDDISMALSRDPQNSLILFCRANIKLAMLDSLLQASMTGDMINSGYNSKALKLYSDISYDLNKVLSQDPDFLYAAYNRAYSRFMMEDYQGALIEFSLVSERIKIAEAHFNKALLLILLDQKEEACVELGIAGELGLKDAYPVIRKFCK